jgi:hypothetical protein
MRFRFRIRRRFVGRSSAVPTVVSCVYKGVRMSLTRLLILLILPALCAGASFAQSQPNRASDLVAFQGAASINAPDALESDQTLQSPKPPVEPDRQVTSADSSVAQASAKHERSSQSRSLDSVLEKGVDRTCLSIRDYRVVRDSPNSDSTHRDGYTTCVPAARFRISITTEPVR